jgi:hypothetical protein
VRIRDTAALFEQICLVQLVQCQRNKYRGIRNIEFGGELLGNLCGTVVPIAELPDSRGSRIQRVDLFGRPVIDAQFVA